MSSWQQNFCKTVLWNPFWGFLLRSYKESLNLFYTGWYSSYPHSYNDTVYHHFLPFIKPFYPYGLTCKVHSDPFDDLLIRESSRSFYEVNCFITPYTITFRMVVILDVGLTPHVKYSPLYNPFTRGIILTPTIVKFYYLRSTTENCQILFCQS